jgi:hypothetical protein
MLEPLFESISASLLAYAKADPDLESLHEDLRYLAMVATADARLGVAKNAATAEMVAGG